MLPSLHPRSAFRAIKTIASLTFSDRDGQFVRGGRSARQGTSGRRPATRQDESRTSAARGTLLVRSKRWPILTKRTGWLAGLFLPLLLSSCAVTFVSSYDEVTDRAVQDAARQTETLIGNVLANETGYREQAKAYGEIDGALGALEMRAAQYEKNQAEITLISNARATLRNFERAHKETGRPGRGAGEGVRSAFRSLIHHELSKKRSARLAPTAQ